RSMHALTVAAQGVPGVVAGAGAAVGCAVGWAAAVPRPRARVAAQTVLAAPRRAAQRRARVGVRRSSPVTTDQLLAFSDVLTDRIPGHRAGHSRGFSPNRG